MATDPNEATRKGVADAWDFWFSQHPVSVSELIHEAVRASVSEWLEDDYGHLSPDEFDQKRKEIYELIVAAKVTPSWPEPADTTT